MTTYLITQATGQQSQWVIKHLLEAGAKIHAVVRDIEKVPQVLRSPGITLFQGESKNVKDILQAAQGCRGAFLNTVPYPGLEILQAKSVVEACQEAGVENIVVSTTFCASRKTMWDNDATKDMGLHGYFASKAEVEDIVRNGNFKAYTILRPSVIHHDYFLPGSYQNFPRLHTHAELDHLLNEGATVPHTDSYDIGKYAAAALENPTRFASQEIDLGNELLNFEEISEILTRVSGREVKAVKRTPTEIDEMGISVLGQKFPLWANLHDFSSFAVAAKEIQAKFGIPFTPFESALQRDKARLLECLPPK
jgi:uncharacterized protein YbjT (DUF2867 family)